MPMTKTGWCLSSNHDRCPHIVTYSTGVWARTICSCSCHPATTETATRRDLP